MLNAVPCSQLIICLFFCVPICCECYTCKDPCSSLKVRFLIVFYFWNLIFFEFYTIFWAKKTLNWLKRVDYSLSELSSVSCSYVFLLNEYYPGFVSIKADIFSLKKPRNFCKNIFNLWRVVQALSSKQWIENPVEM